MKIEIDPEQLVDIVAELIADGLATDRIVPASANGRPIIGNTAIADARIQWSRERARNVAQRISQYALDDEPHA